MKQAHYGAGGKRGESARQAFLYPAFHDFAAVDRTDQLGVR